MLVPGMGPSWGWGGWGGLSREYSKLLAGVDVTTFTLTLCKITIQNSWRFIYSKIRKECILFSARNLAYLKKAAKVLSI